MELIKSESTIYGDIVVMLMNSTGQFLVLTYVERDLFSFESRLTPGAWSKTNHRPEAVRRFNDIVNGRYAA